MTLSLTLKRPAAASGPPFKLIREDGVIFATEEQERIIHEARKSQRNLIINALAGAAKTTTLEFLCAYLPVAPTLCLAFNKRIAEEMTLRLPGHVTCRTMNSLGHRVWASTCGKQRLLLADNKTYTILKAVVSRLPQAEQREAYDDFGDTLKLIALAKRTGYIPDDLYPSAKHLISSEEFYAIPDESPSALQRELIDDTLHESIQLAYSGTIDFNDQIYMPTLFGGSFPKFPLVMVDEAQDLSEINHQMLYKLATGRLIAVGDPWQSIYAFRGAKQNGMQTLESHFNALPLPLSVSFRCPRTIVEHVRGRVPHMQWRKEGGHVEYLSSLNLCDIPDGSAIICRNNAPLFRLALLLLGSGRGVHLVGTDLGPSLVKTLKKLGHSALTTEQVLEEIDDWEREKIEKAKSQKAKEAIADKASCLRVFAEFGATLGGAITYCEHLFNGRGAIQLLSGHKSKGGEWPIVYYLDPWRVPSPYATTKEELEQEKNVNYVICTRAQEALYFIDGDKILAETP